MAVDPLEIILDDMDDFIDRQIVYLTIHVHGNLVEATPVDLGWARANWVPDIGRPYRVNITDFEPTSGAALALSGSVSAELATLSFSYNMNMGPIFLSNNVPYIGALDAGHSPQAPPGYVQATVERSVEEAKGIL